MLTKIDTVSDFTFLFKCLVPHDKRLHLEEYVVLEPFIQGRFRRQFDFQPQRSDGYCSYQTSAKMSTARRRWARFPQSRRLLSVAESRRAFSHAPGITTRSLVVWAQEACSRTWFIHSRTLPYTQWTFSLGIRTGLRCHSRVLRRSLVQRRVQQVGEMYRPGHPVPPSVAILSDGRLNKISEQLLPAKFHSQLILTSRHQNQQPLLPKKFPARITYQMNMTAINFPPAERSIQPEVIADGHDRQITDKMDDRSRKNVKTLKLSNIETSQSGSSEDQAKDPPPTTVAIRRADLALPEKRPWLSNISVVCYLGNTHDTPMTYDFKYDQNIKGTGPTGRKKALPPRFISYFVGLSEDIKNAVNCLPSDRFF
ncbi:hypothetical protein Btru_068382 [Bulinus truncatus]|nr:hypothetical protein Btru_068382 [Bulinus truncatus]